MPIVVAVILAVVQLMVGIALLANYRPVAFALAGVFLNLNFMAAGRVNPWRSGSDVSMDRSHDIATRSTAFAAVVALLCLPFARTLEPSAVIEDPAMVLVCLSALLVGSAWLVHSQNSELEPMAVAGAESLSGAGSNGGPAKPG